MKKCLILSDGPVPTPEHPVVEGGGLRCWGLAQGILANDPSIALTVAYNDSHKKDGSVTSYKGVNITTWTMDELAGLLSEFDTVLVSYCMGELSVKVADLVAPNQQLILDCYVPIYVEVSARQSANMDAEYYAFQGDVNRWDKVLRRGDLFLCAHQAQKDFYKGVLAAVGRVNPATYGQELIRVVPYGIYEEEPELNDRPISKLMKNKSGNKVLWFGGIYPWFDLRNLVDAVGKVNKKTPTTLVIVGAKNPFNSHPDFVARYDELIAHINRKPDVKESVILQDWVEFEERANWYLDSDLVVVVNKEGEENKLAWRTRLIDFMWANLPIITNGGDPLGELLINEGAARRFSGMSVDELADGIDAVLEDKAAQVAAKKNIIRVKKNFYWRTVTKEITQDINADRRAIDLNTYGVINPDIVHRQSGNKAKKAVNKAKQIPSYARKYGLKNTYFALRTTAKNQLNKTKLADKKNARAVFISHQLDMSGAPFVIMDVVEELKKNQPKVPISFHTYNPADGENITRLNRMGVKPHIHLSKDVGMQFNQGDVVILNTVGHSQILKNSIYSAVESGIVGKLIWYIHEDEPEIIFHGSEVERIKKLLKKNQLVIMIAADKTLQNYRQMFENADNIRLQPYKYKIPERFQKIRQPGDFQKLSFILPGTMGDGRKGQLPVFYAAADFYKNFYRKHPEQYRDFELVYVGITDDFLSRQVLKHAKKALGDRFVYHGRVSHERSSELIMKSNVTICYSLRECLPLFVFEGMAAGHPILRNDSSGMKEQLFRGDNGFYLDSTDFQQIAETFEHTLNIKKTSNKALASMSAFSNKVALQQANNSYRAVIEEITRSLN